MAWSDRFTTPIQLPTGDEMLTLRDAGAYISRLPNSQYKTEAWRVATHLLIEAAEGSAQTELARFAILEALTDRAAASRELASASS